MECLTELAVSVCNAILSPPQRLLLVNTRERTGSGSAGERKRERGERSPRALIFPLPSLRASRVYFFPRRDCGRPLRRRENAIQTMPLRYLYTVESRFFEPSGEKEIGSNYRGVRKIEG